MCGIAGVLRWDEEPVREDRLQRMSDTIAHRGPDSMGIWREGRIGLAHRRLAIIDLSTLGAQPMTSLDGRYVITFNGEIYNYLTLREDCERRGDIFRSHSDTEVLLQLYARKGPEMLADLRGMFAFAIWDRKTERLFCARDRVGKKPFFYQSTKETFAFASELKALMTDHRPEIDQRAIRVFLGLQYVPAPLTGFKDIHALPPGYAGMCERSGWRTWKYDAIFETPAFTGSFTQAKDQLRHLLEESIRLRLISDVPIGAFLSGGIDSSTIVGLTKKALHTSLSTFTMGFPATGYDERPQAQAFAKRHELPHHAFEASSHHASEALDTLTSLYESPYADSSALPTWLLARETAKHVKVVLTGDGADELFAGYRRHAYFAQALRLSRIGGRALVPLMRQLSRAFGDQRILRFSRTLAALKNSPQAGYAALFTGSYFSQEDEVALLQPGFAHETEPWSAETWMTQRATQHDPLFDALTFDRTSYLPDDLNVKMDRATMAHGLEARSPFLDQEVVAFASSLPTEWLLHNGKGKWILKEAFADILPKDLLTRKKRGFQVPLASWFRGELRPLFEERCLSDASPIKQLCQPHTMATLLKENDRGVDHGNRLWMLISLATWLEKHGHPL